MQTPRVLSEQRQTERICKRLLAQVEVGFLNAAVYRPQKLPHRAAVKAALHQVFRQHALQVLFGEVQPLQSLIRRDEQGIVDARRLHMCEKVQVIAFEVIADTAQRIGIINVPQPRCRSAGRRP